MFLWFCHVLLIFVCSFKYWAAMVTFEDVVTSFSIYWLALGTNKYVSNLGILKVSHNFSVYLSSSFLMFPPEGKVLMLYAFCCYSKSKPGTEPSVGFFSREFPVVFKVVHPLQIQQRWIRCVHTLVYYMHIAMCMWHHLLERSAGVYMALLGIEP